MLEDGSTDDSATSGERSWGSRLDVKKEQAISKWGYDESGRERCGCMPGEAEEKEFSFVHNAMKCDCATCQYRSIILLLFLQKQNLANVIYPFGLGTLHVRSAEGMK